MKTELGIPVKCENCIKRDVGLCRKKKPIFDTLGNSCFSASSKAYKDRIVELKKQLGLCELALSQGQERLKSCEAALSERDARITELKVKCEKLEAFIEFIAKDAVCNVRQISSSSRTTIATKARALLESEAK